MKAHKVITVKEFLEAHPNCCVSIFTPSGDIHLTAEEAGKVLTGGPIPLRTGEWGFREMSSAEVLRQVVVSRYMDRGVWYIMSEAPKVK